MPPGVETRTRGRARRVCQLRSMHNCAGLAGWLPATASRNVELNAASLRPCYQFAPPTSVKLWSPSGRCNVRFSAMKSQLASLATVARYVELRSRMHPAASPLIIAGNGSVT